MQKESFFLMLSVECKVLSVEGGMLNGKIQKKVASPKRGRHYHFTSIITNHPPMGII